MKKTLRRFVLLLLRLQIRHLRPAISRLLALADVFDEFKKGMEDDGDSGDYETHYNLGIAFKEMGLMEEAIGGIQKALSLLALMLRAKSS